MAALRQHEVSRAATRVAEALGLSHFIAANFFFALGEVTSAFDALEGDHKGVAFVMTYIDAPVYALLGSLTTQNNNTVNFFMWSEFIVIVTSGIYAALCWIVARIFLGAFRI